VLDASGSVCVSLCCADRVLDRLIDRAGWLVGAGPVAGHWKKGDTAGWGAASGGSSRAARVRIGRGVRSAVGASRAWGFGGAILAKSTRDRVGSFNGSVQSRSLAEQGGRGSGAGLSRAGSPAFTRSGRIARSSWLARTRCIAASGAQLPGRFVPGGRGHGDYLWASVRCRRIADGCAERRAR
jgi:hypothetical protein